MGYFPEKPKPSCVVPSVNDNIDDGDDGIGDDEEGIDDGCVDVDVGDQAFTLVAAEQRPADPRSMFPAQVYVSSSITPSSAIRSLTTGHRVFKDVRAFDDLGWLPRPAAQRYATWPLRPAKMHACCPELARSP